MSAVTSTFFTMIRTNVHKMGTYVHSVVFGRANLLLTNALISASMGTAGDAIQQHYDIFTQSLEKKKQRTLGIVPIEGEEKGEEKLNSGNGESDSCTTFSVTRSIHMTMAGLTTGIATHYWYIVLDRALGVRKTPMILAKKILLDQVVFSPINLFVYFSTLGICEQSNWRHVREELMEKGFENIYIVEWLVWPPMQLINFALMPLRYRILFDNVVSLGFDIYSPYVKYKTSLRSEQQQQKKQQPQQTAT